MKNSLIDKEKIMVKNSLSNSITDINKPSKDGQEN
jgi:hypothetical protein